jgi:hypothetical protein
LQARVALVFRPQQTAHDNDERNHHPDACARSQQQYRCSAAGAVKSDTDAQRKR